MATFGRLMRNGIIMALDEWNAAGGLLGHQLTWRNYDTECAFAPAQQAARRAIGDGLTLFIGPLCSEAALAVAPLAAAHQVLMISPTATHPAVTVDGQGQTRPTVFRVAFDPAWQGRMAAAFAYDRLGAGRAVVLANRSDDYAAELSQAFSETFTGLGGAIVYQAGYAADLAGLAETLTEISQAEAEIIYLPAPASIANQIAGQWQAMAGVAAIPFLGSDRWDSTSLDLTLLNGAYFPSHFLADNETPAVRAWVKRYKAAFAVEPDSLAVLGYDAAQLLAEAVQEAGSFEPMAIAPLLGQGSFAAITGPLTFDERHNPAKPVPMARLEAERRQFFTIILPRK
jgi:branched-chain amino acid transport system substrate-binding protein